MSPYGRHPFDASGRVQVRREMTMGDHAYTPGEIMRPADRETLADRQLATLWQLGQIDTLPRDAEPDETELERLTAPAVAVQKGQPTRQQARR